MGDPRQTAVSDLPKVILRLIAPRLEHHTLRYVSNLLFNFFLIEMIVFLLQLVIIENLHLHYGQHKIIQIYL